MTRALSAPAGLEVDGSPHRQYLRESQQSLTCLMFLLPMILAYEVGTAYFTTAAQHGREQQIVAFTLLQRFFRLFGVHGQHLPALAVAMILICSHIISKERWQFSLTTLAGMAAEATLLALPLIALGRELARYFPLAIHHANRHDVIIMSFGAGVYEELVFRLIFFSILSLLLKDVLRFDSFWMHLLVVATSGLAFSAYHYLSPVERFQWRSFVFRTVAGGYFGVIFLLRGFGVTAGCHAFYDILILFL